jgi:hypothetical protein
MIPIMNLKLPIKASHPRQTLSARTTHKFRFGMVY